MVTNRKSGRMLMSVFAVALIFASVFTATAIVDTNFTEKTMSYRSGIETSGNYTYEDTPGSYRDGDYSFMDADGANIESSSEPEATRSNHNTQINVPAPSNAHINTWSGNLFHPVSILSIPGRGSSIDMFMSYNSGWHDFTTNYGHGWQLSHNIFYVRVEKGDIIVVGAGGGADRFTNSNGSFIPPVDTYNTFQEYQPAKYVLRTKDGMKYYFDSPVHKRVTTIQDPNGNVLNFTYNPDMLLTTITDASGRQVNFDYTNGKLTKITDSNTNPCRSVQFQYDANNNLISIIDLLGNTTAYGYDSDHYLTRITDTRGNATIITYFNGTVVSVADEFTNRSFSYDSENKITTMTDFSDDGDQITHFYYDAEGRVTAVEDPLGNSFAVAWDENNNIIASTDANGNTAAYIYDSNGNLLTVTDAENHTATYTYENIFNRLTSVTDANGHTTTYEYDLQGNLVKATDPLGYITTYTYDDFGDLVSKTDANGFNSIYEYDKYGNLIGYLDNTFTYDTVGNMLVMNNSNVNVTYAYDALNGVTDVNYVSFGKSITYTYNEVGNRISMTDPDGGVTNYAYDEANRLISLTNPLGQTTTYTYDSIGRLVRKEYHNDVYAIYTYDAANRLLSLANKNSSGDNLSSYTYEYDAAGNRISMTEVDGNTTTYAYDDLYQLTSATYLDGSTVEYTYDATGNRLTLSDTTGTTDYDYDDTDRLLSTVAVAYDWDNNGNLISKTDANGITTYTHDHENRLISITFPDGKTNTFAYYPDGRRLSKTDTSGDTIYYLYDGPNTIIEADSAGTTSARYTSAGIDDWISMERCGSTYHYHKDGLGSVTGLTNSGGAVAATYSYDVFGSIRSQTGSVVNPYRFTGREYDGESGLYYYRARYYDAMVGRFLSPDPVDFVSGVNLYAYVRNNPININDPLGLMGTIPKVGKGVISTDPGAHAGSIGGGVLGSIIGHILGGPIGGRIGGLIGGFIGGLIGGHIGSGGGSSSGGHGGGGGSPGGGGGSGGGSTGGGGGSGGESIPLKNVKPSYFRQSSPQNPNEPTISATKTTLLKTISSFFLGDVALARTPNVQAQSEPLVTLIDIIPTEGPVGTEAVPLTPSGPFDVGSNAVDTAAMDFIDSKTSLNKATVFATMTINRTYDHDYAICNRFHDYRLETAAAVPLPDVILETTEPPSFWYAAMTKDDLVEEGFLFVVFVDDDTKTFTVDSHWLTHQYPTPDILDYDYVFNFQIWATSSEEAYNLLRKTLENLSDIEGGWTVVFANTEDPTDPTVLIKSAELTGSTVRMTVQSWLNQTQKVNFSSFMRYPTDLEDNIPFTYEVTLEPGFNMVELPLGNILDCVIAVQVNDFRDKIYVGCGAWFAFDDSACGGSSNATLTLPNCIQATNLNLSDFPLSGCAEITGTVGVNGWAGVARTLNPNDRPIDVRQYPALTFSAKGDGKSYRVSIETESVRALNSSDFHRFVFTTSSEWRQFVIPFSSFSQREWDSTKLVPYTGEDVISVAWSSVGDPLESINLSVCGVAFFNSLVINGTTVLADTTDMTGPYMVMTQIKDDVGVQTASLHYSVDSGHTFTSVPMVASGNTSSASIPGQPLGTEVWYYVEATDADGNVATDPVDIPRTTYRFQINEHPYLLVDDFADTNPVNVLGGNSGPFGADSGSSILAYYDGGYVQLDYDVSATNSYAGYYSLLEHENLTQYNAVTFKIKGSTGGEKVKVGLRDDSLKETKIGIGEYLPEGITPSWQKVTIPLLAFTRVTDWSSMDNFNVNFESRIDNGAGTVCLDDIKFEHIPFIPVVVDNFNDMTGENGVGGFLWTSTGGGAIIDTAYDQQNAYGGAGAGYRISYSGVTETTWATSGTDLMWVDASEYNTLSFCIKGAKGGEKPNIYLYDGFVKKFVNIEEYVPVTTSWQKVDIPLEDFALQGVNITNLSYFQVVFEWEEMSGTIYLDDIQFHVASKGFDTGYGRYPSISGIHKGTITPNKTIIVRKMYTYPCVGTGGHTEYVRFYGNGLNVTKTWNGYIDDYHNIFFDPPITLEANTSYNYEIRTGSYPQIIHEQSLPTVKGTIKCTQFTDVNGKIYYDWIPAIRLE